MPQRDLLSGAEPSIVAEGVSMLYPGKRTLFGRPKTPPFLAVDSVNLCLRKGEKLMPASVVNQLLDDRVAEIEATEAREVYRRERRRLRHVRPPRPCPQTRSLPD